MIPNTTDSYFIGYRGHGITNDLEFNGLWTEQNHIYHINYLEMKAAFSSLQSFHRMIITNISICFCTIQSLSNISLKWREGEGRDQYDPRHCAICTQKIPTAHVKKMFVPNGRPHFSNGALFFRLCAMRYFFF